MKRRHPGSHDAPPVFDDTGPSSSQTPYLDPSIDAAKIVSLLSVGDQVGLKADGVTPWRMAGIPDGLGAFDNGDGTITVLMNHELGGTNGVVREHGSTGAFVSKLIIDKETLQVLHAEDLSKDVFLYNSATDQYVEGTTQFSRFCSADLAPVSAFFDEATGLGTTERIFLKAKRPATRGARSRTSRPGRKRATATSCRGSATCRSRMCSPIR